MTQPKNDRARKALNLTLAAVTSLVGCITVVTTIAALLLGLWLDARFGTRPTLTIVVTLVSLPVTLVTMFVVVRWTTSRMLIVPKKKNEKES
ncbi:MAG: AtpZ/AtpI family protein [Chloroflexi bacterium]|nr:AtpZ/AtpI family protein [Chloroflexota bacterium]